MKFKVTYTSDGDLYYIPDEDQDNQLPVESLPANLATNAALPVADTNSGLLPQNFITEALTKIPGVGPIASAAMRLRDPDNPTERAQFWPEKTVRSGLSLPFEVMGGQTPVFDPDTGHVSENIIGRAQDMAALTSGSSLTAPKSRLPVAPSFQDRLAVYNQNAKQQRQGVAMFEDAVPGAAVSAVANAAPFYSAVEQAVKNAKMNTGTAEQWQGYLKNQPGVKSEELGWMNLDQLPTGQISKEALAKHVEDNAVKVGEVWKQDKRTEVTGKTIFQARDEAALEQYQSKYDKLSSDQKRTIDDKLSSVGPTAYHSYQLPGGENYKEMLLTLPSRKIDQLPKDWTIRQEPDGGYYVYNSEGKMIRGGSTKADAIGNALFEAQQTKANMEGLTPSQFRSAHWSEPNVIAHVRMNDRFIPDPKGKSVRLDKGERDLDNYFAGEDIEPLREKGLKSLHMEEIQSDWHQQGRKEGYKSKTPEEAAKREAEFEKIDDKLYNSGDEGVLGHPVLEQAIDSAVHKGIITADEGKTYLKHVASTSLKAVPDAPFKSSWADLALKRVIRQAAENGYDSVSWTPGGAQKTNPKNLPHEHLTEEQVAKADEGQKAFYDKMIVDKVNAIAKKFGGKVEKRKINGERDLDNYFSGEEENQIPTQTVHVLKITPELRKAAMEKGFPLFESGIPGLVPVTHDPFIDVDNRDKSSSRAAGGPKRLKFTPVAHVPDFI